MLLFLRTPSILHLIALVGDGVAYTYGVYVVDFVTAVLSNPSNETLPYGMTLEAFIQFVNTIPYCQLEPNIQYHIEGLSQRAMSIGFSMM